jgi:hypothetical protein
MDGALVQCRQRVHCDGHTIEGLLTACIYSFDHLAQYIARKQDGRHHILPCAAGTVRRKTRSFYGCHLETEGFQVATALQSKCGYLIMEVL